MVIRKIFKGKHRKECHALFHVKEGTWNSPWVCPEFRFLDKNANKTGSTTTWVRFICNDPNCKAKLFVLENHLLAAIGEGTYERVN